MLEHNVKPSTQRTTVMEYLANHPIHPSVDDICITLSPSMSTLPKTTVYDALGSFSEQGVALILTIDEKDTNFDADTSVHSRFLYGYREYIYDLRSPGAMKKVESLEMDGHQATRVYCYYGGICRNCLEEDKEARID